MTSAKTKKKTAPKGSGISGGITKRSKIKRSSIATTHAKVRKQQRLYARTVITRHLSDSSVVAYRAARGYAKRKASEAMGERGAVVHLNDRTGSTLSLFRPTTANPFTLRFDGGKPWTQAVAFNGCGVADVVHWDGSTLHVVEAKGGGSALKTDRFGRMQRYNPETGAMTSQAMRQSANPIRLGQGTVGYLADIGFQMMKSSRADGRAAVGQAILGAIEDGIVEYLPVSTKIEVGDTDATVMIMDPDGN